MDAEPILSEFRICLVSARTLPKALHDRYENERAEQCGIELFNCGDLFQASG
jgi:hypothetical protein